MRGSEPGPAGLLVPGPVAGHTEGEVAQPAGERLLPGVDQSVPDHVGLHVGGFLTDHTSPQLYPILINYLLNLKQTFLSLQLSRCIFVSIAPCYNHSLLLTHNLSCLALLLLVLKYISQPARQGYGLSPVWTLMWVTRSPLRVNTLPHSTHRNSEESNTCNMTSLN